MQVWTVVNCHFDCFELRMHTPLSPKCTEGNRCGYVWIILSWFFLPDYLLVHRKQQIWRIFDAFKAAICHILTLHETNTFQPELDQCKLIKSHWDDCVFNLYKLIVGKKQQFDQFLAHSEHSKWQFPAPCTRWANTFRPEMDRYEPMKPSVDDFSRRLQAKCLLVDGKQECFYFHAVKVANLPHSNPA